MKVIWLYFIFCYRNNIHTNTDTINVYALRTYSNCLSKQGASDINNYDNLVSSCVTSTDKLLHWK